MTKKELEAQTVAALRGIASQEDVHIPYNVKRKDEIIKILLKHFRKLKKQEVKASSISHVTEDSPETSNDNDSNNVPLTEFPSNIIKFDTEKSYKSLQVSCGANTYMFPQFEGKTAGEIRAILKEVLDIDTSHTYSVFVDGESVDLDYKFTGDEKRLEYLKEAGSKGTK